MSKKLEKNGLWESSRMTLPQHKERIVEHVNKRTTIEKPTLHEDEWENIAQNINLSISFNESVVIEIYNQYGNRLVEGVVSSISKIGKKLRLEWDAGYEWVDFDEIVSVKSGNGCDEQ
ncbi:YolD-like family protein [Paenibacillus lautus]|uniref:YolD-like family protein n=1 Tax=Paenibacillus lautus TaxID=1401 RepID=UPI00204029BF|nr:YolD-like family protein [Paenibacillus lautus]MCM3257076.1 YolD-like family protein [Paenibacillus lautus]